MNQEMNEIHQLCLDTIRPDGSKQLRELAERLRLAATAAGDEREHTWATLFTGISHSLVGEYDVAMPMFDAARTGFEQIRDHAGLARTLQNIGRVNVNRDDGSDAMAPLLAAFSLYIDALDIDGARRVLGNLEFLHTRTNQFVEFQSLLLRLIDDVEGRKVPQITGMLFSILSMSVMIHGSDAPKAIEYAFRSLELCEKADDTLGCARALDALGGGYWYLGEAGLSAEYGLRAVSMSEASGEKYMLIQALTNAAFPFMQLENYSKVLELNERALKACIDNDLVSDSGWAEMGIGHALLHLGDAAGALLHDNNAVTLLEKSYDPHGLSYALHRKGQALVALHQDEEAIATLHKSLELRRQLDAKLEVAEIQAELGRLLAKKELYSEALVQLNEALTIAEEVSGKAVIYAVHQALAEVHVANGDLATAYAHLMKYVEVRNEVQSQESAKRAAAVEYLHQQELQRKEQEATDRILNSVLPLSVSRRLKSGQTRIADSIASATVIFVDIVGFTPMASQLSADELVELLDKIFRHFDMICARHGVEKIKTIGDAYMAVGGAPEPCEDHAVRCARVAVEMLEGIGGLDLDFRIGLHCGELVAGVIGDSRIAYDLWGDTVNTAARMESHGAAGHIHVTDSFRTEVMRQFTGEECPYRFADRGVLSIKGKGAMQTYYLSAIPAQTLH